MLKLLGLLAASFCLCSCQQVSGQSAAVTAVVNAISTFRISNLNTLSNQYNNLRDDVYGHFFRSQNVINDAQNNLFNAGQKIPYYAIPDATVRNNLSESITSFMEKCTRPTVQYLRESAILPLFKFNENNTTPMEIAFQPITEVLERLSAAVSGTTDDACLNALRINAARLRALFGNASNQINGCIRTTFTAYRTPISLFSSMHFSTFGQLNTLVNDVQSCSSVFSNRTACAIRVTDGLCSTPTDTTCSTCGSLQKLKSHSITMVEQTQELFYVCLQNTASQIENTDSLFKDVQACSAPKLAEEENTTVVGDNSEANQVIDSKIDEVRIGTTKSMQKEVVSDLFEDKDNAEYDYLTVY